MKKNIQSINYVSRIGISLLMAFLGTTATVASANDVKNCAYFLAEPNPKVYTCKVIPELAARECDPDDEGIVCVENQFECDFDLNNPLNICFEDQFRFISPGEQSRKMDLQVASILEFTIASGAEGDTFGCSCGPKYPSRTDPFRVKFNETRDFTCTTRVEDTEDQDFSASFVFEGRATNGGLRIERGKAFDAFGISFVYTCEVCDGPDCFDPDNVAPALMRFNTNNPGEYPPWLRRHRRLP
jgi:hypothetical protein